MSTKYIYEKSQEFFMISSTYLKPRKKKYRWGVDSTPPPNLDRVKIETPYVYLFIVHLHIFFYIKPDLIPKLLTILNLPVYGRKGFLIVSNF